MSNFRPCAQSQAETQEQEEQSSAATKTSQQSVIQLASENKPANRRNRVVTPAGSCGFTTARQIVKASMDKYRQEQGKLITLA